jgi:hypothetical protein
LAAALGIELEELIAPTPPSHRDRLEIALLKSQESSLFDSLDLPAI